MDGFECLGSIILEVNHVYDSSQDNPQVWGDANGSVQNPGQYWGYTPLNLDGYPDASAVWQTLIKVANQINAYAMDYDLLQQNSNSVVSTLLSVLGLGVPSILLANGTTLSYPAQNHKLYFSWLGQTLYKYDITGNDDADDILYALDGSEHQGSSQGVTFVGQPGDTVQGLTGSDQIHGGTQDNVLVGAHLSNGFDPLNINFQSFATTVHSELDDGARDTLYGGLGHDTYVVGGGVRLTNFFSDFINGAPSISSDQIAEIRKLDLIDGTDTDFVTYSQFVVPGEQSPYALISAKISSSNLASATKFDNGTLEISDDEYSAYYLDSQTFGGVSTLGVNIYDAALGDAVTLIISGLNGYYLTALYGIKGLVSFDPSSSTPWTIFGKGEAASGASGASAFAVESLVASSETSTSSNSADNDILTATMGADKIYGLSGDDTIIAAKYGGGDDYIDGGSGAIQRTIQTHSML